ncbi:MAG TPA: DUF4147 domain-containing protein [Gammaproteobacteria bacterium]|nr:DUF4147 domain-containing protein [Gammaproteobacteria bacterium]
MSIDEHRHRLLVVLQAALGAVDGATCVGRALQGELPGGTLHLVAVGKAACAMTRGALGAVAGRVCRGLVITKSGHVDSGLCAQQGIHCREAGHPVPDRASLAAGAALLQFIQQTPMNDPLWFLISGGASSLVEVLPDGLSLEDLAGVNRWLLASGLDIRQMNRIRSSLSAIKAGRLLRWLQGRRVLALLVSDVRGDDPAVIGSGLLVPGSTGSRDMPEVPPWLRTLTERQPPVPAPGAPGLGVAEIRVVARLEDAKQTAADCARRLGGPVTLYSDFVDGAAAVAGRWLARRIMEGPPGFSIWGGETTVCLPAAPGCGGRCQSLALAAALEFRNQPGVALLAVGTDGGDGSTEDAGALVDGASVGRGESHGLDGADCLARADAGTFLAASGDLIQTGPTGTNVMDLMIGWRSPSAIAVL